MSSATARVFKGCMALLAAAKSPKSTVTTTVTKLKPKSKPKTKQSASSTSTATRTSARPGILKEIPVSPVLGNFLGAPQASRPDAVKQIWAYIKTHNLQNPTDKREVLCDEKLKAIFDGKDKVGFLEIGKLLSLHFVKAG